MKVKALYQRFRAWQRYPYKFQELSAESHHCVNCGNEYQGNFCPRCGQGCSIGRVSWSTLFKEIRDNLGNGDPRFVLNFILQLFGRPGYMIGDYLDGRRKACNSPAARLVVIAAVTLLVLGIVNKSGVAAGPPADGVSGVMGAILGWLASHLEWAVLIQTVLIIFPTWLLFRFSPRHTRHTLPEGFYIQVFMGSLVLICILLRALFGDVMLVLIPLYYFISYRQLFGYGVWGTLWRTVLSIGIIFYFFGISMAVVLRLSGEFWAEHTAWEFLSMFGAFLLLGVGVLLLGWWIGKRTA